MGGEWTGKPSGSRPKQISVIMIAIGSNSMTRLACFIILVDFRVREVLYKNMEFRRKTLLGPISSPDSHGFPHFSVRSEEATINCHDMALEIIKPENQKLNNQGARAASRSKMSPYEPHRPSAVGGSGLSSDCSSESVAVGVSASSFLKVPGITEGPFL